MIEVIYETRVPVFRHGIKARERVQRLYHSHFQPTSEWEAEMTIFSEQLTQRSQKNQNKQKINLILNGKE